MNEWWNITIVVAAGLLTVFNLCDKVIAWIREMKKPTVNLEERIAKIENKMELEYKVLFQEYELRFKNDMKRLDEIEASNKITQKALLGLMRHALDGNDKEKLQKVADELNDYIFNK